MSNKHSNYLRVNSQIDEWKKRLIDLSRKNNLIFFNPDKKNSIEIKNPSYETLFSKLFNEKKLNIWLPKEESDSDNEAPELFVNQLKKKGSQSPRDSEIVFTIPERKETERRIKNISRKASFDYLEKGIRTSIIIFGLLWWKEKETQEEVCSPLILYPVEIFRENPKEPYKISSSDEDVLLNPAIQVKLEWDFKMHLPEPNFENDSFNLNEYLRQLNHIGQRNKWRIEPRTFLCNLSFHKIAMYQDITMNNSLMAQHPIIQGLANGYLEHSLCTNEIPNEKELDNEISTKRMLYILDADSSQSKAIETAVCGHSFVLKGPPGTGKSQTISNIIAEFLEEGKTVLFVSEKMAALEVVFNRLKQAKLTDYCLELHSHKANKKDVIKQLAKCLDEHPIVKAKISTAEFEQLKKLRNKLNEYVLELHLIREPLGKSMYQVFCELSMLDNVPLISIKLPSESFSPIAFQSMKELISKLRNNYRVLEEGNTFPWRGFKSQMYTQTLKIDLLDTLSRIKTQIHKLNSLIRDHTTKLGIANPVSLSGCKWVIQVSKKLTNNPTPIILWFSDKEHNRLLIKAKTYWSNYDENHKIKNILIQEFDEDFFKLSKNIRNDFTLWWNNLNNLISREASVEKYLLTSRSEMEKNVLSSIICLEGFIRDISEIQKTLGLSIPNNYSVERIRQITQLVDLLFSENKPERVWFEPVFLSNVTAVLNRLKEFCCKHTFLLDNLSSKYSPEFLSLDIGKLLNRYNGKYKSGLKFFLPSYYFDNYLIKKTSKTRSVPASIVDDLKSVNELKGLETALSSDEKTMKESLGSYYNGFNTNINATESALETVRKIIQLTGEFKIPNNIIHLGSFGGISDPQLRAISRRIQSSMNEWVQQIGYVENIIPSKCFPLTNLPLEESPVILVKKYFEDLANAMNGFNRIIDSIEKNRRCGAFESCLEVLGKLDELSKVRTFEENILNESEELSKDFGTHFSGLETNWPEIIKAMNWTNEFLELINGFDMPNEFIINVVTGFNPDELEILEIESECKLAEDLIKEFEAYFDEQESYFSPVRLSNLNFDIILNDIEQLTNRIDDLRYWIDYVSISQELRSFGLHSFLNKLAVSSYTPEQLNDIFIKSFYSSWVNKICDEVKVLGHFRGVNHDDSIAEFRSLDKKLNNISASLIIENLNKARAGLLDGMRGSEISVLRDQAARVRRHLPLRILFSRIPNLLLRLKPCLLMSPLSVSHFIDQINYKFDLVIFDEASQICSEDAVGAIARGQQLVVAGDNKQLPPTKFFQGDLLADDDNFEDSNEDFGFYQSVLDDCERIGLTPQPLMLKWHYRSKHEDLITYSNRRFYENKLVTFPCAKEEHDDLGIKFVYVQDGIF